MIKYTAVINYLYKPYLDDCLATLKLPKENILIIDGDQPSDPGLAGSINEAVDFMRHRGHDWLIIINPAMRFGEPGGLDIIEQLETTEANFVFFGDFAWHCCAINREVFDAIGKLDPNFYPVYFEDVDFDLRYDLSFGRTNRAFLPIDAYNESMNHSVELAGKAIPTNDLIAYFATKWGKHPMASGIKSYDHPFNDKNNRLAYWPPAGGQLWNE